MKAIYTRHVIKSDDPFGDDYLRFEIYFKTETLPELKLPISPSLDDIISHTKSYDENVFNYLSGIRKTIHGYGPKHSKVFEIMNNEGFDLTPHIIHFLESIPEEGIQRHVDWCSTIQTPAVQKDIKEQLKSLDDLIPPNAKQYSRNLTEFKDQLDTNIHETVLKFFPELFEKGEKHIDAYKHELINFVLRFSSEIDHIMHDKFNPYWEEKYNIRNNINNSTE